MLMTVGMQTAYVMMYIIVCLLCKLGGNWHDTIGMCRNIIYGMSVNSPAS